nr:hypothetical protein [uncultured Flavobacterium sp.]
MYIVLAQLIILQSDTSIHNYSIGIYNQNQNKYAQYTYDRQA